MCPSPPPHQDDRPRAVISQGIPSFHSALLYMNADFEGGEFIFTEMDAKTVTVSQCPFLAELSYRNPIRSWDQTPSGALGPRECRHGQCVPPSLPVSLQASIKPKCGRMVSFSSGGENPHGVKAVTKGQRCAVALWFTLDPLYRELVSLSITS